MDIPAKLTPFSQSILLPAQESSLRRLAQHQERVHVSLSPAEFAQPQKINAFLAESIVAIWGGSPPEIGRLLGVDPPAGASRGKAARGVKMTQKLLQEFPRVYARLHRWSEWVFSSEWSQAQLLQVMEEIEPMVAEALHWEHALALAAVGAFDHLGALLAKKEKDPARMAALRLGLVTGLETPDSRFVDALASGMRMQQLRERFGHMPFAPEGEIALPRVGDVVDALLETPPVEMWNWDLGRAQKRQAESEKRALAQAGLLGRSGLRKAIDMAQQTFVAHAQAREGLAYVLAAARHWALAAADEGAGDGRIHHPDEIFMLEIEEIKQMMTGEWHSRRHVESLIGERKAAFENAPVPNMAHHHPLGVAGYDSEGACFPMSSPKSLQDAPPGFIALAGEWHPGWWRVILRAEGVIDRGGHLLNWMASVARSGDLPALVGGEDYAEWRAGAKIRLDPARNRAELAN